MTSPGVVATRELEGSYLNEVRILIPITGGENLGVTTDDTETARGNSVCSSMVTFFFFFSLTSPADSLGSFLFFGGEDSAMADFEGGNVRVNLKTRTSRFGMLAWYALEIIEVSGRIFFSQWAACQPHRLTMQ
jgi:hypothetical protein